MRKFSIKRLPLITIAVAVVLAIALLLFLGKYADKEALSKLKFWEPKETTIESQDKDSDNDGLRDWEEDLYKTDLSNPDTDGDGYLDGEEINSGHNPLVKGPGDELVFYPLPLGDVYNVTKRVLKDEDIEKLIESYLLHKSAYLEDHPEINDPAEFSILTDESTLIEMSRRALYDNYETLIANTHLVLADLPEIFDIKISDSDIKITQNNDKETVESYLTQASGFLNSEAFFFKEKTFQVLTEALEKRDPSKIQGIVKDNDSKIERIKQLVVPSTWKEIHKEGLRIIILTRNIFASLRDLEDDPIKALVAVDRLEPLFDELINLIKKAMDLAELQEVELPL